MRLIDLDKAMSICDEDNNTVIFANIENAEVKAIPIKWLRRIMTQEFVCATNSNGVIHFISGAIARQVISSVIELWEKENQSLE